MRKYRFGDPAQNISRLSKPRNIVTFIVGWNLMAYAVYQIVKKNRGVEWDKMGNGKQPYRGTFHYMYKI